MMNEMNHKTVFVLDHTQYFGISSDYLVEVDFGKSKGTASPIPPISKSLWTCSVESSAEYCRIVWDLFPTGKLVRFVVSDANAHIVNTWSTATQNMTHVLNAMAMVGIPPRASSSADHSVIHGLRAAIEALAEPTELQRETIDQGKHKVVNKGRVICMTSARDDLSMKSLEDIFHTVIEQQNFSTSVQKTMLNIDFCHLVIINLFPSSLESLVSDRCAQDRSPVLRTEIHSVRASDIPNKLLHLIMPHYDLASTTVTGIPMKEEQNASSSANYDVEIFHDRQTHAVILNSELILPTSIKEGAEYETVTLKWCTPRSIGASDMQPCLAQHRVTPVDVTSRPSSCLTNFLLNGRSVLLEMPKKSGGKLTSHLLSSHGGEIFIHTLQISRTCLEDPPSILEGVGGKVTDYRLADFAAHIKSHRLIPMKADRLPDENLVLVRTSLNQRTAYFPLTVKKTIVYNMQPFLEPILKAIVKETITEDEIFVCKKLIFAILNAESKNEPLPMANVGYRFKGANKNDERYRLFWAELDLLVTVSGNSSGHKEIQDIIRNCALSNSEPIVKAVDVDQTVRDLAGSSKDNTVNRVSVIRATTDSPLSPSYINDIRMKKTFPISANTVSLFDMVSKCTKKNSLKRIEFSGRLCTPSGQPAKLYSNLGNSSSDTKTGSDLK